MSEEEEEEEEGEEDYERIRSIILYRDPGGTHKC
jgi:hypothetical protein